MQNPAATIFATAIGRMDPDELLDAARQMRAMVEMPGWQVFLDLLDRKVDADRLSLEWGGKLPEYEEMVALRGSIRGLTAARAIPDAVIQKANDVERELQRTAAEAPNE